MPTFDSNVFDVGLFDTRYVVPLLRTVKVEPQARVIAVGGSVTVTIHLINAETTYGRRFNLDPEGGASVELFNPDQTLKFPLTAMTNLAHGKYFLTFTLLAGSQQGGYSGRFSAVNGDKTLLTPFMGLFEVV